MHIDLAFHLQAVGPIPADHGYALYAAVSHLIPEVHQDDSIAIHPICGRQIGERRLMLMPWSTLSIRVPDGQIAVVLKLAGKSLRLDGAALRVGVPEVRTLTPSTAVRSRLVIIKLAHADAAELTTEMFTIAARKKMNELGIGSETILSIGKRRSLRMKQREIVGYEIVVKGLAAAESITLQENGLGGKRHMGCGVFVGFEEKTA
jgi:CRISPR-associated protein Cas6